MFLAYFFDDIMSFLILDGVPVTVLWDMWDDFHVLRSLFRA